LVSNVYTSFNRDKTTEKLQKKIHITISCHIKSNVSSSISYEFQPHHPVVFLNKKRLPSLFSTGWFQEQIKARFTQAKIASFTMDKYNRSL